MTMVLFKFGTTQPKDEKAATYNLRSNEYQDNRFTSS